MKGVLCVLCAAALLGTSERPDAAGRADGEEGSGGLVTLYPDDPLARTFSFEKGLYGGRFEDRVVRICGADVDVENYLPGEFMVAIEPGTSGSIVDLGTAESVRVRYGYQETFGGAEGFASIRNDRGRFEILKKYATQTYQTLEEGRTLAKAANHAPIVDDHLYLVRLASADRPPVERFVKLLVVSYSPGESVTFRYECLD
jgi:hypothetical protein